MPNIRQSSFAAGELSPLLWTRGDSELHSKGARRLRDFFVSKDGSALSRPGTVMCGRTGASTVPRLVPFIYSDSQSFVLEVGVGYIRFWSRGALVTQARQNVSTWQGGHVYAAGDVCEGTGGFYRCVKGGTSAQLYTTLGPVTGALNTTVFDGTALWQWCGAYGSAISVDTQVNAAQLEVLQWAQCGDVMYFAAETMAPFTLTRFANDCWAVRYFSTDRPFAWCVDIDDPATATSAFHLVNGTPALPTATASQPAREWEWEYTGVIQNTVTGATFETLPYPVTDAYDGTGDPNSSSAPAPTTVALYTNKPVTLRRAETQGLLSTPDDMGLYRLLAYNFYRGKAEVKGLVGQTKSREFVDIGDEPNYLIPPPRRAGAGTQNDPWRGHDPFRVERADGTVERTERPLAVAFFQGRLCWGGTVERPTALFLSAIDDYLDHDPHLLPIAGQALYFELASRRREQVRTMAGLRRLAVLTDSSAWTVGGFDGAPLDFDSLDARLESDVGSSRLPPLVIGDNLFYVRSKGTGVRALVYSGDRGGYSSLDVSATASHLLGSQPFSSALRNPGLLTITDWCYQEDPWGVVWAVSSDRSLLSLTPTQGGHGWAKHTISGATVQAVCAVPEGDEDAVYLVTQRLVAAPMGVQGNTNYPYVERMASRRRRSGADDDVCVDGAYRYSGTPTASFSSLTWLEGKEVWMLAAGNAPIGPATVTNGAVTFRSAPVSIWDDGLVVAHVGMLYQPELESLDAALSERLRQKTVSRVAFELAEEVDGLQVGQSWSALVGQRDRTGFRTVKQLQDDTHLLIVPVKGKWDEHARACLRQTRPLPVTVLGLTRELDVGG